jgi:hypothetical protein
MGSRWTGNQGLRLEARIEAYIHPLSRASLLGTPLAQTMLHAARGSVILNAVKSCVTALSSAFLVAACSTPPEEASEQELTSASAIAPVDMVNCWVVPDASTTDPFYQKHELRCAYKVPSTSTRV